MRKRHLGWTWIALVVAALMPPAVAQSPPEPAAGQRRLSDEQVRDALFAVRREVLSELAAEIVANLPDGHLAILPPEVTSSEQVDAAAAASWQTAWAEELRRVRNDVKLSERGALEAILREQKFGDSPYADGGSAVAVGKIAAARSLLLTTVREFRVHGREVRLHLESRLLDVETGEVLWSRDLYRGMLPRWLRWPLTAAVLLAAVPLLWVAGRFLSRLRRARLVRKTLPRRRARLRVDVDSLARAVAAARERLFRTREVDGAVAVQRACDDLEPVLDRVRHALPGGAVTHSRARDLRQALRHFDRIGDIVRDLRHAADAAGRAATGRTSTDRPPDDGLELAARMGRSADDLRATVDSYRGFLP